MPEILDKLQNAASNKLGQKAQPGDSVERTADSDVNNTMDSVSNNMGVPQQDDNTLNEVADSKVNSDIPFGNN